MIGLVLHASHRPVFEEAARTVSGLPLDWVVYEHEDDIRARVEDLLRRREVTGLLMGPVPYAKSRDLLDPDLPVAIARSAGVDLTAAFYRALANGWRPVPVSVDTYDAETVDEVARTLELNPNRIRTLPYDPGQSVAEIVTFHRRYGGDYVITLRTAVAAELDGVVPILRIVPGPATIRADLHELALRIQSRAASALRFAAGVFVTGAAGDPDRARVGLMNLLLNTPEFADAWVENRGRRGVVVFAHRALFERVTHHWVSLPVLGQAQDALGTRVAAGFGVGPSARTCVQLAERAVARAEQESGPAAYLIEDSGVMIGPMRPSAGMHRPDGTGSAAPLRFTYRDHGASVEDVARRAGLSPATLSRLVAIERTLGGRPISPSDLADALGITDPSGRRLVRKLGRSGLVTAEGSAQVHRRGRPTRLYRLGIGDALHADGEASDSQQLVPRLRPEPRGDARSVVPAAAKTQPDGGTSRPRSARASQLSEGQQ